jgi:O-antigen/teichoic acid export membrane protein
MGEEVLLSACGFAVTRATIATAAFAAVGTNTFAVIYWVAAVRTKRQFLFFSFRPLRLYISSAGPFELSFRNSTTATRDCKDCLVREEIAGLKAC